MLFLYILAGIILLVLLLTFLAPKNYHVSRSITIERSLVDVFQYIKFIKNQDHWSPWEKKDPHMKKEQTGTDGTVGFIARWEGNKEVGSGEQEITNIVENEKIETQLRFLKPWKSKSDAYIKVEAIDSENTQVTWGFSGVNNPPSNIFMLFFNMDKVIGKDFEEGLSNLKERLES